MFDEKKIHLIGIGGVSMSSIALMLDYFGAAVTGSDMQESIYTNNLIDKGITVLYGHHPELINNADIIVYTAAISKEDPERLEAEKLHKEMYERAEFLGLLMKYYKNNLCISGTHGKSTTSGMVASIFLETDYDPTINVGAVLRSINGNTKIGKNDYFIMEACEYVDSFLHFHPTASIITNIDNDHLDYFKNIDNIKKSFGKYVEKLPDDGFLIKNNDDENSDCLNEHAKCQIITYGIKNKSMYMAKNISINKLGHYSFDVYKNNNYLISINPKINGSHNVYNALAAFALSHQYINDINILKKGIESFTGVGRRFEYLGTYKNAYIYDDYAHHPTELKTTLNSVKEIEHNESWAVFQSHTYSRTKEHMNEFCEVLNKFDHVIIATIYAAREINTFNISEDMLVEKIKETNKNVIYIDSFDKIVDYLKENVQPNDLVISIGAGPINKVTERLVEEI